eukprot:PhM_4_TR14982/c0_g1_i1/m.63742
MYLCVDRTLFLLHRTITNDALVCDRLGVLGILQRTRAELGAGVDLRGQSLPAVRLTERGLGNGAVVALLGGLLLFLLASTLVGLLEFRVLLVELVHRDEVNSAGLDLASLLHRVRGVRELLPGRQIVEHRRAAVDVIQLPREHVVVIDGWVWHNPLSKFANEATDAVVHGEDQPRVVQLTHLAHHVDVGHGLGTANVELLARSAVSEAAANNSAGSVCHPSRLTECLRVHTWVDVLAKAAVAIAVTIQGTSADDCCVEEIRTERFLTTGTHIHVVGLRGKSRIKTIDVDRTLGTNTASAPRNVC